MKVTALEPSGNLYGSEYCLLDIIEGTSPEIDWDVVVPAGGGFDELLADKKIPASHLLPRNSHTLPLTRKLLSYWNVRKHIVRMRPDVVYINQAGMLRAATAMTKGLKSELVCQIQTLEDAALVASLPSEQSKVRTFICNSRFIAAAAGVKREKLSVLYQPMMPGNRSDLVDPPASRSPWRVGILGRISETKGHYLLIKAARILVDRGDTDIRFVVIGEGLTPAHTEKFEFALEDAGLKDNFELRGYRAAAHEELANVHAVVIPSVAEPFGRVLLDAASTGRPAIVSDGGGLGELNLHFNIGRSFKSQSADALADAIEETLSQYDDEILRFSGAAERMLNRLDPDAYCRAVAIVIKNAAQGSSTSMEWLGEPQ